MWTVFEWGNNRGQAGRYPKFYYFAFGLLAELSKR